MKIAVIPARGGSKRIPRKNIRLFAGKPIIGHSIEAALATDLFDKVIVSTDDEEIAAVAAGFGAEIPFLRPKSLADDYTGTNAVAKHAIQWFMDAGQTVDFACCIYATVPFLRADYLREGHDRLVASGKSFAFSVTGFPSAVQRALRINQDGFLEPLYPQYTMTRSQDLESAYHDAGQFYWGRADAFLQDVVMYSTASIPVILPRYLVQDIDTEEDWEMAEIMYQTLQMQRRSA